MTSLLEGARRLVTRGSGIGERVAGLEAAVSAARGRIDDQLLDGVETVTDRVGSRLRLSADHTVVAIAGATGSGKSSTFNGLTGLDLSAVGMRRPTTSWATACVWGSDGADELLDWLDVPPRHRVARDSMLDTRRDGTALDGVVLLDLPDHDSTEVSHHLEVDRLVTHADLLVWVLDPQKYADAAVHDRYLKPMASHKDVVMVVLNHIDTVPVERREAMVADLRRLLDQDGLDGIPLIPTSAREGEGIDELRRQIATRVEAKKATRTRLAADVGRAAEELRSESGTAEPGSIPKERVAELEDAFADAGGVPTVVEAVRAATRDRANRATGWPLLSWVSRFRPDPLKRLHLDLGPEGRQLAGTARTSLPEPTGVQRARVDTAVRRLADEVSFGLRPPWAHAIRSASTARLEELGDRLDHTLGSTDLGADRLPVWAGVVRVLQWLLLLAALVGGVWLVALAAAGFLQLPEVPTPELAGIPLPTLLLLGGVGLGVLLALVCRVLVAVTARRRARQVDRRLRAGIHEVARDLVVEPIEREVAAYEEVRRGLDAATA